MDTTYLRQLEQNTQDVDTMDTYLWPRTPISNLQAEMWQRCNASDWRDDDVQSRPFVIIKTLEKLRYNRLIPGDFTALDICCGDALILAQIRRAFPHSWCHGIDINAGRIPGHNFAKRLGVELYRIPIQSLFENSDGAHFDVTLMLNTYRGWNRADLRQDEEWMVEASDEWFRTHSRFTILTVGDGQIDELRNKGFWVTRIGRGEDGAAMVLLFPCSTGDLRELWSQQRR